MANCLDLYERMMEERFSKVQK